MIFIKLGKRTQINLILQCIGMLIGTSTHLFWVINQGFLSERYNASLFSRIFWDSLTFFDPFAAVLLILKPKIGIWITAIIVVADVLHNGVICFDVLLSEHQPVIEWAKDNWMFWTQFLFGLFVVVSFKNNLKALSLANGK